MYCKYCLFILFVFFLFSCKAQKANVKKEKKEDINIKNDIAFNEEKKLQETAEYISKKIISELLNINIQKTKYDTDKDLTDTGKPPILEETNVTICKNVEEKQDENLTQTKNEDIQTNFADNSETKINTEEKNIEQKKTTPRANFLTITGVVAVLILIFALFFWIRQKLFKK
ncbi:hypothetical protein LJC11_03075 [Bacteroidales bacterium OttesenSCG-928-I21]|nr:hypothetical protein [Bacteroidales bacterium OttesenSCG-928-I21]